MARCGFSNMSAGGLPLFVFAGDFPAGAASSASTQKFASGAFDSRARTCRTAGLQSPPVKASRTGPRNRRIPTSAYRTRFVRTIVNPSSGYKQILCCRCGSPANPVLSMRIAGAAQGKKYSTGAAIPILEEQLLVDPPRPRLHHGALARGPVAKRGRFGRPESPPAPYSSSALPKTSVACRSFAFLRHTVEYTLST